MRTVQAVLFDYGLVLSGPPDPAAWERLKHIVNANEAIFYDAYWKHRDAYDRGSLTPEAYWRQLAADVNHTLDEPQLQQLIDADNDLWTQPNPPMIDWTAALHHAGIKTGILSNMPDAVEKGVLARCPWLASFTHLTFSYSLKMAKPDLAIYRSAADGLNTAPADILFIDDRENNIVAARIVGMQAVQYTTHEAFLRTMKSEGFESLLNL